MPSRLARNYAAVAVVILIFIVSFQLLRTSGSDSPTTWSVGSWSAGDWASFGQPPPSAESAASTNPLPGQSEKEKIDPESEYGYGEPSSAESASSSSNGEPAINVANPPWATNVHDHQSTSTTAPESTSTIEVPSAPSTSSETSETPEAPSPSDTVPHPNIFKPNFTVPSAPVTFDPSGPQPSQIALLTATDGKGHNGGIPNIVEQTAANRREYCAHHGYVYQFVNISGFDLGGAHAVWAKLPAIAETFAKNPAVEWVWWLDLDAIIMTPNRTMQDVVLSEAALRRAYKSDSDFVQYGNWSAIPGARTRAEADWQTMDFLISQDQNGLNAGSFLIRRSAWSKMLLDMWGDPLLREQDWVGKEQDALLHLVKNHAVIRKNIGLIQQRTINGYSEGDGDMGWQVGDIAVHFAGCWVADVCAERWAQFWEIRGRVGSDAF